MTPAEREALRALAEAATPGPWASSDYMDDGGRGILDAANGFVVRRHAPGKFNDCDFSYIAAVYPDVVLGLLDALDAAERELDATRIGASAAQDALAALQDALAERDRLQHALECAQADAATEVAHAESRENALRVERNRLAAEVVLQGDRAEQAEILAQTLRAERDEIAAEVAAWAGRAFLPTWKWAGSYWQHSDRDGLVELHAHSRGYCVLRAGRCVAKGRADGWFASGRAAEAAAHARGLLTEGS